LGGPGLKELRFEADGGVWRVAFAFDPKRKAILLVAGDKSGGSEKRFLPETHREGGREIRRSSVTRNAGKEMKWPLL
jgi:hypothetical protein